MFGTFGASGALARAGEVGLRVLAALVAALPARATAALGRAVGWFARAVLGYRHRHVVGAMQRAGVVDPEAAARSLYRELGISMVETLVLGASAAPITRVRIDAGSRARWEAALGMGRGVVIAGTHTGNWDLAACAVAQTTPLLVVSKRLHVKWLDRYWQRARAARGVRLAYARGALSAARSVMRDGGAVVMMIDQVPALRRHGCDVEFLGGLALTDRSPATLAAVRRAPLVVAAGRRDAAGDHVLHVLDVLVPPAGFGESGRAGARRAWIEHATAAATAALERFVRMYPDQWLWLHRRWKRLDPAAGAARLPGPCRIPSSSPDGASRAA
jgi:KDO2-lipid IV(A) lauroyltransferase